LKGLLQGHLVDDGKSIQPLDLLVNLNKDPSPIGGKFKLVFCLCGSLLTYAFFLAIRIFVFN
jgi:hypothetical protein